MSRNRKDQDSGPLPEHVVKELADRIVGRKKSAGSSRSFEEIQSGILGIVERVRVEVKTKIENEEELTDRNKG